MECLPLPVGSGVCQVGWDPEEGNLCRKKSERFGTRLRPPQLKCGREAYSVAVHSVPLVSWSVTIRRWKGPRGSRKQIGALRGLLGGITQVRESEGVCFAQTQSVRTRVAQARHRSPRGNREGAGRRVLLRVLRWAYLTCHRWAQLLMHNLYRVFKKALEIFKQNASRSMMHLGKEGDEAYSTGFPGSFILRGKKA